MRENPLSRTVRIPAGEFVMGSEEHDEDERPVHTVHLDEFFVGVFPVTNDEYATFVRETGHRPVGIGRLPMVVGPDEEATFAELAAPYLWKRGLPPRGRGDHPVTLVRFDDALHYCGWLAAATGKPVRLPLEAEWEKAARGGLEARRYPWGDDIDPSHANFLPASCPKASRGTTRVGSYPCNGYRLHDVAGNAWEWVGDWYDPAYYGISEYRNPQGPASGRLRIVRGGSWVNEDAGFLRCAKRHPVPPDTYSYSIGFRIAYSNP
jgi:formylglycine-generating enzyme